MGAGYDKIDVPACAARGIRVSHTPGAVNDATATTALYLLISALRNFSSSERSLRSGHWQAGHAPGRARDLTGRTLAILGLGGIGLRLAELAHAFPMRVLYHSRRPSPHAPAWCEYFDRARLDEMLAQADALSVHVPYTPETQGLVDATLIRKLKRGAVIINTARGQVVDEEALMTALRDGHVSTCRASTSSIRRRLTSGSDAPAVCSRPRRVQQRTQHRLALVRRTQCRLAPAFGHGDRRLAQEDGAPGPQEPAGLRRNRAGP